MASIYAGDFVNGAVTPSWAGVVDRNTQTGIAGLATILTSKVTGSGTATAAPFTLTTYFTWQQLLPPLSNSGIPNQDRAEYQGVPYSWTAYENTTQALSFAVYLPSAFNWSSNWAASSTSVHNHPVLMQPWSRGVQADLINLHPPGYQGLAGPSITWFGSGGQIVSGGGSNRLAVATDWQTLLTPGASATLSSQRFPQLAGSNTQTGVAFPIVYDTWMEFVLVKLLTTTGGNGYYQAYAQVYGSGVPWVKVLDTPANYNTMCWDTTGSAPAHADGVDDIHAFGGYVYSLPQEIDFGLGGFHTYDGGGALAAAQAVFHTETAAGAPSNTGAPQVSGLAPVGSTLSVTNGTWTNTPTSYTYQWTRDGSNIGSATASTYVSVTADATHAVGCKVTATNATGSTTQASATTVTPTAAGSIPTWVAAGTLSSGTGDVTPSMPGTILADDILILVCESQNGQAVVLGTANGFVQTDSSPQIASVAGGTRITTFWKRAVGSDSAPVITDPGDHVVASVIQIRGCKTSGNPWNTSSGGSRATNSTSSSITGATTTVDNCLIVQMITDPADSVGPWFSAETNADLGSVTERVDAGSTSGDGGIIGVITGTKAAAGTFTTTTVTNASTDVNAWITLALSGTAITAPVNSVAPVASGTLKVGSVLSTTDGTWSGTPTFTYQWKNAGGNISGATANTYTLLDSDDGSTVHCTVSATNSAGVVTADTNSLGAITEPIPVNSVAPVISEADQIVLSTPGTWSSMAGAAGSLFTFQWQRDGADISGATSDTYAITSSDYWHAVLCLVVATNSGGSSAPVASVAIDPVIPPAFGDTDADVPGKYDVVIDGHGYIFWNALLQSLPFRNQRAAYYYYPTFLERTNVSGNYGDDSQAFWLTATQNDWSEGEGRRYFRSSDSDLVRRYWQGENVDPVSIPGQVTLNPALGSTIAYSEPIYGACASDGDAGFIYSVSATTLYFIQAVVGATYVIAGDGAHGCGNSPELWGMAHDGFNLFLSSVKAGTVGVRKWVDGSSTFSTFSAQPADSLAFLNNTLFGYLKSTSTLYTYDTGGTATASFTWKAADGGVLDSQGMLSPYGGQLLILRYSKVTELWQYDGTGVALQTDFPDDFKGFEVKVVAGVAFISGLVNKGGAYYPTIYYFVNGQLGQLWQASSSTLTNTNQYPTMAAYGDGLAFTDDTTGSVFQYDIAFGGIHQLGTFPVTTDSPAMAAGPSLLAIARNQTTLSWYPDIVPPGSGSITTSLFDFDNSLLKVPRGIKVEFDSDGDSQVDIAYQYDSVDGAFTTLQTNAVSGTEYILPTTTAHSIAVKVTINLFTSDKGCALKRIFVRAAPLLTTYRRVEYDIDLTGTRATGGALVNPVQLRNGNEMPLSGQNMADNLKTSQSAQIPVTITDRMGTFTGVFEQGPGVSEFDEVRPGEYIAHVTIREV